MPDVTAREALTDAIGYWERRRLLYNGVLLLVVAANGYANRAAASLAGIVGVLEALFVLAVLANVAYCAAYVADVLAQMSAYRSRWLRLRWGLFVIGTAFAAVLANFLAGGLLGVAS
jgi:hypothetical protein